MISELERTAMGAAGMYAATLTLPNAFIIGASRSGTTSLHEALGRHPDIFAARKEPNFFARNEQGHLPPLFANAALVPQTLEDYADLFGAGAGKAIRLDTSPSYLDAAVAKRIAWAVPDARIVCILRHPVDQARSWAEVELGHPPGMTELSLTLDGRPDLREHGQYHRHLASYFDPANFPRRQIFVRTFEELTSQPVVVLSSLQRFLGVQPIALELPHWNRSGASLDAPGSAKAIAKRWLPDSAVRALAGFLHRLRERKAPPPAERLPQAFRDEMLTRWYPDVVPGLERLGIDVEAWKR